MLAAPQRGLGSRRSTHRVRGQSRFRAGCARFLWVSRTSGSRFGTSAPRGVGCRGCFTLFGWSTTEGTSCRRRSTARPVHELGHSFNASSLDVLASEGVGAGDLRLRDAGLCFQPVDVIGYTGLGSGHIVRMSATLALRICEATNFGHHFIRAPPLRQTGSAGSTKQLRPACCATQRVDSVGNSSP